MNIQLLHNLFLVVACFVVTMTLSAQCVDYGVQPNKTGDQTSSYNLSIKNNCDSEVYFVVMAKKEDGKIHSLLKGQLSVGEKIKHKSYGPFDSTPVGQHIAVNKSNVLVARKKINNFVRKAQATNVIAGIIDTDDLQSADEVVSIEE